MEWDSKTRFWRNLNLSTFTILSQRRIILLKTVRWFWNFVTYKSLSLYQAWYSKSIWRNSLNSWIWAFLSWLKFRKRDLGKYCLITWYLIWKLQLYGNLFRWSLNLSWSICEIDSSKSVKFDHLWVFWRMNSSFNIWWKAFIRVT